MSVTDQQSTPEFGTNSWIVEEMYRDFLADPSSVAESWRDFFSDYRPAGRTPAATATAPPRRRTEPAPAEQRSGGDTVASTNGKAEVPEGAQPIRGVASTIAENMNASRAMPTATSLRDVPAKLLEVNRRVVNGYLGRTGRGKVSFTHIIGYAVVRAIADTVPVMNNTFVEGPDGKPYGLSIRPLLPDEEA